MINGTAKLHRTVRDKTASQDLEGILVWAAAPDMKDGIRPLIMDPTEGTDEFTDPIFGVESLDSPDAHHPVTVVRITPPVRGVSISVSTPKGVMDMGLFTKSRVTRAMQWLVDAIRVAETKLDRTM